MHLELEFRGVNYGVANDEFLKEIIGFGTFYFCCSIYV